MLLEINLVNMTRELPSCLMCRLLLITIGQGKVSVLCETVQNQQLVNSNTIMGYRLFQVSGLGTA